MAASRAPVTVTTDFHSFRQVASYFATAARAIEDEAVYREAADILGHQLVEHIQDRIIRNTPGWELAESTIERRQRYIEAGYAVTPDDPLFLTGALVEAITFSLNEKHTVLVGVPNEIHESVDGNPKSEIDMGRLLKYLVEGTSKMPPRDPFDDYDGPEVQGYIKDFSEMVIGLGLMGKPGSARRKK